MKHFSLFFHPFFDFLFQFSAMGFSSMDCKGKALLRFKTHKIKVFHKMNLRFKNKINNLILLSPKFSGIFNWIQICLKSQNFHLTHHWSNFLLVTRFTSIFSFHINFAFEFVTKQKSLKAFIVATIVVSICCSIKGCKGYCC